MNLQAVYNAPGTWIKMRGTPNEYRPQPPNQYGPYAFGKITDDQGQAAEVMFASGKNSPLPDGSLLNTTCVWAVKYDANTQKLKALFNSYAIQNGQQPSAPQGQPPQQANEPYHVPVQTPPPQAPATPPRDATGLSIERQATVKAVCERYAGTNVDLATMLDACHHLHKWIATGEVDFTVTHQPMPTGPTDPNQDDSDLPPELRADYQG